MVNQAKAAGGNNNTANNKNKKMAYRNNNRRGGGGGNFGNNFGGRVNPWDSGMGGPRGNQGNDALTLANSLISNLLRNQNSSQVPPSLLDMPNNRYDDFLMRDNNRRQYNRNYNKGAVLHGGIRKPNAFIRSKQVLAKNSQNPNTNSSDDASDNESKKTGQKVKKSPYRDISNEYFYCHMCDKHMYDYTSFDNHMIGRTHAIMKDSIEESYRMKAMLLRQEARIAEQLKTIEIERLKRNGKGKNFNKQREYCPMCELYFYGHIAAHRKSDKHLDLKKFLHPKCDDCSMEFHNRTEYDDHLLSPKHMKHAKTKPTKLDMERRKYQLHISSEAEELQDLREEQPPRDKKDKKKDEAAGAASTDDKDKEMKDEAGENGDHKEPAAGDEGDDAKMEDEANATKEAGEGDEGEEVKERKEESPDVILDLKEGDPVESDIETRVPRYKKSRSLGLSQIGKLECFVCNICHKYFDNEATCEIHSRTHMHYRSFVKLLNEKSLEARVAMKRAVVAIEEAEKKRKQAAETAAASTAATEGGENGDGEEKKEGELYDPSEATESGDASMCEDVKADESQPMATDDTEEKGAEVPKEEEKTSDAAPKEEEKGAAQNKGGNKGRRGRAGRYGGRY